MKVDQNGRDRNSSLHVNDHRQGEVRECYLEAEDRSVVGAAVELGQEGLGLVRKQMEEAQREEGIRAILGPHSPGTYSCFGTAL